MTPEPRPRLDLVTQPEELLVSPDGTDLPRLGMGIVAIGTTIAGGLGYLMVSAIMGAPTAPSENGPRLLFDHLLALRQSHVSSQVKVIADDARIRTALATPGVGAATLDDLLRDLQRASGLHIVGLIDPRGIVRGIVGLDELHDVDLSGSSILDRSAQGSPPWLWAYSGRLLIVALAPVRLGYDEFFVLGASDVDAHLVNPIRDTLQVRTMMLVGDDLRFADDLSDELRALIVEGSRNTKTSQRVRFDGSNYLITSHRLPDIEPPVRVVWLLPHGEEATQSLAWIPWAMVALVLITGSATCWTTWRAAMN